MHFLCIDFVSPVNKKFYDCIRTPLNKHYANRVSEQVSVLS